MRGSGFRALGVFWAFRFPHKTYTHPKPVLGFGVLQEASSIRGTAVTSSGSRRVLMGVLCEDCSKTGLGFGAQAQGLP